MRRSVIITDWIGSVYVFHAVNESAKALESLFVILTNIERPMAEPRQAPCFIANEPHHYDWVAPVVGHPFFGTSDPFPPLARRGI